MSAQEVDIDITRYTIISKIGEGSFSKVYRVKDLQTKKSYAAKVCKFMIDEDTKDSEETRLLFREVNLISLLNHPSVLKFIGYYSTDFDEDPFPTIITELAVNGSLREIIKMEAQGLSPSEWTITKKLINIYGIATGMSYLHAHNILHRDLKPENILVDEYLHPKISDFGLSKITDFLSVSMNFQSQKGTKGTPAYMAPEIMSEEKYSRSSDVYAFGFIVYEIMTCEEPFGNYDIYKLMKKVMNDGYRPPIRDDVPNAYKDLIEKCWSQKSNERPSFKDIVYQLKTNNEFIGEFVDKTEYYDYIDFIDKYQSTFDVSKRTIHFSDFIKIQGRSKEIKPILFGTNLSDEENETINTSYELETIEDNYDYINKEELMKYNQISSYENQQKINENENQPLKINESENSSLKVIENDDSLLQDNESKNSSLKVIENDDSLLKDNESENGPLKINENENQQKINENENQPLKINENENSSLKVIENGNSLLKDNESENGPLKINENESKPLNINKNEISSSKTIENKDKNEYKLIYPLEEFNKLSKNNQNLVEMSEKDGEKSFEVGQFLIEGKNGFPNNVILGIKYIKHSVNSKCINALVYYTELLIKGKIIREDLAKANKYLIFLSKIKDNNIFYLQGLMSYKKNKFKEAAQFYFEGSQLNNPACMYKYGKMLFIGEGTKKSNKESIKYFTKSNELGYLKSGYFLSSLEILNKIKQFSKLPSETQMIFIMNNIKNNEKEQESEFNQIFLSPKKTEKIFFNKALKSTNFYECLKQYQHITIELEYPSESFKLILDLVIKIHKKHHNGLNIGVVFSSFEKGFTKECFSTDISYHRIDSSIHNVPPEAFKECSSLTQIIIHSSVTVIGSSAFRGCSSLTQIAIPSSVTRIGDSAFSGCSSLTQITIPSSVTSIGKSAFSNCSSLTKITIPSSVTSIGFSAFDGIKSLELSGNLKKILNSMFSNCSSLEQIIIPSSVTSIGSSAFSGCSSLTQITIPSSVTQIGNSAFSGCSSLTQITIPSSVTSIGKSAFDGIKSLELSGNLKKILYSMFFNCSSLEQITIPSSVTQIEDSAFSGCSSLTQITISSSVTQIGDFAFSGCSSLKQITIPSSVTEIKFSTFSGCSSLTQVTIPSSVTQVGSFAFGECSSLTKITIPSSVTKIGLSAFDGIKSLELSGNLKKILNSMFFNCSSLTQITIPSSVTQIEYSAFSGCSSLTQIAIPSSVTQIDYSAFSECSSLTQITIPTSVTQIGDSAFSGCSSLTQITIPSSVTEIKFSAFSGCSSLTQITIPSSVIKIGDSAFSGCSSLTQITIPSSVTEIKFSAFSGCSSLTQITIPSSVIKIGGGAFNGCIKLHEISIQSDNEKRFEYFDRKFFLCKSKSESEKFDTLLSFTPKTETVIVPQFIEIIENFAFRECSSLKQITIPSSVTEIGSSAFSNCSSLTQITIPSSVTKIGNFAFRGCLSLTQIIVPSSLVTDKMGLESKVKITKI